MRRRFEGRGVLVTGASRGLGRAVASAFAKEGARVGMTYRTHRREAEEALDRIEAEGGTASLHELDVRDLSAFERTVRDFEDDGPLDILVNNAAIVHDQPFALMGAATWRDVIDTNLTGVYNGCRCVVTPMMARRRGAIVNVVSVAGRRASPGQANYAASKGGVIALTRTLAAELAGRGIRVNAVMPGLLDVGMGSQLDHRVLERRLEQIPAGRRGRADEAATAILFLASDDSSYVFGQVLAVDGGLTL